MFYPTMSHCDMICVSDEVWAICKNNNFIYIYIYKNFFFLIGVISSTKTKLDFPGERKNRPEILSTVL